MFSQYEEGYCYLVWFARFGSVEHIKARLGPYPLLHDAVVALMPYVSNIRVSFEGLLDTYDFLYHVSPCLVVEFADLVDTALRNPRHRVGAMRLGKMELLLEGGVNPVELAKGQILKQILNDPDESKALVDAFSHALEIEVNRPKRAGDVVIRQRLSISDQLQLRRNYTEYQIIFSST